MSDGVMLTERAELLPFSGNYYLWKYLPSIPAAVVFIIVFLILSAAHTWKMYRYRMWFCTPFVIGGYLEVIGYIGRTVSANATDKMMPYIIQSVFILVPPSLFAASIYMTLGRIMRALGPAGEASSIIRVRWLTTIFVVGDVFSFFVQSGGASLMSIGTMQKLGQNIVIAGLILQVLFFGLFVAATVAFHLRFRQHSVVSKAFGASSSNLSGTASEPALPEFPWEGMISMLYATSALILVRSIFRIVEYCMGVDGYLLTHEWTLYVFDATLMVITMAIFFWWYPSEIPRTPQVDAEGGVTLQTREAGDGFRS